MQALILPNCPGARGLNTDTLKAAPAKQFYL